MTDQSLLNPVRHTLPNGLRLLAMPLPHVHRAVVHAQLNIGSRFESPEENGISHFLEHMLYRGTRSYPSAHEQALAFEGLGGTLAAATATDMGSMAITVPPGNLPAVLPILAEVFLSPRFEGITIERGIVSEEILEGLDDDGNNVDADNLIREAVFRDHALGMPITGTLKHLRRFTQTRLGEHHRRYYTGKNTVIAIAGAIDPEAVLKQLERELADVATGSLPEFEAPVGQTAPQFQYVKHSSSQTELRVAFRGPGAFDVDEPAMELLLRVLDDGLSTRLYHRICDQRGLCYDVSGHYETYADSGLIELAAESAHDRAASVLEELLRIASDLRETGPTDDEIARAKQRHRWQFDLMQDDAEETAEFLAVEEQMGLRRTPTERHAQIEAVSRQRLIDAANRWFAPTQLSVVAVGMLKKAQRSQLERLAMTYA